MSNARDNLSHVVLFPFLMRIVELFDHPHLIPNVVDWIEREWPTRGNENRSKRELRLCGNRDPKKLPVPLIALVDSKLVGVVCLTQWEQGIEKGQPHWIDVVLVAPAHRMRGIGVELVRAAEKRAKGLGVRELHALTPYPRLYLRANWIPFQSELETRDMVLKKSLV